MLLKNSHNPDVLSCLANLSNDEVFTPPQIANQILDLLPKELWSDPKVRFLDPVCKSGVFLREIAKRLDIGLSQQFPDRQTRVNHILRNQIFGIAITELTGMLTRRSLYCSKHANGKFSVVQGFKNEQGNIRFSRTEHKWVRGRCSFCGANQTGYERGEELETHAYEFIHTEAPEGIFNMKFDVIIGNPPYQLSDGGFGTSAIPIYHQFVQQGIKLEPRYLTMIIPARWFSGGRGLDDFRDNMLNDDRIRSIFDFPDATSVFPGVQIKGGVCYFLWERDSTGPCSVVSNNPITGITTAVRPLLEPNSEIFIRFNEAIAIWKKIETLAEPSIQPSISMTRPFGLRTFFKAQDTPFPSSVTLYQNGGVGHVPLETIETNVELISKYKVLIPRAGSGSDAFPHPILGKPFVVEPNSACTETYIVAGAFDTLNEALRLEKYIRTRFFRFLVLLAKPSQDAPSRVYRFVPQQPDTQVCTDEALYSKYGLTQDEIAFIESMVRPMEPANE